MLHLIGHCPVQEAMSDFIFNVTNQKRLLWLEGTSSKPNTVEITSTSCWCIKDMEVVMLQLSLRSNYLPNHWEIPKTCLKTSKIHRGLRQTILTDPTLCGYQSRRCVWPARLRGSHPIVQEGKHFFLSKAFPVDQSILWQGAQSRTCQKLSPNLHPAL